MKLTLQQMEQSLSSQGLSPEKSRKAVETLLTQVEILNEIATSFSAFARMPAPVLEQIDLSALLKNVVSLHQTYPEGTVSLKLGTPIQRFWRDAHAGRVHAINDPARALSTFGRGELGHDMPPDAMF